MDHGQLHYVCRRRKQGEYLAEVVTSPEEANDLFVAFHANEHGGHCGMEKTVDAISLRYYWPGMEKDIRKWVLECPQCQARKNVLKIKKAYIPIEPRHPHLQSPQPQLQPPHLQPCHPHLQSPQPQLPHPHLQPPHPHLQPPQLQLPHLISSRLTLSSSRLTLSSSRLTVTPSPAVCVPLKGMKVDSDTLETVVQKIWAGEKPEVLWSKVGPYKLFTHNLREHLCPDELVESEVSKVFSIWNLN
ncbi:uncharacterized protein LOC124851952 [Hippoglossus stenolepis]|uniref:uncharacterized protein LOC124851952 n=1 Tax=Hippoglossus stenolepis TaxID=195615 RepID=UPI001FB02FF1|nr:uncharacterized protein LOC124851952 [Hippoglossus stenolepis]